MLEVHYSAQHIHSTDSTGETKEETVMMYRPFLEKVLTLHKLKQLLYSTVWQFIAWVFIMNTFNVNFVR